MDFFSVPTATFRLLYVLLIIQYDRRKVLHVNLTAHPTAAWVTQQLREAFPFTVTPRYLLMDRDAIFSAEVRQAVEHMGVCPVRTSIQSSWQNGVAERWIGTCRRELLDHVIVLNEQHLQRLLREFLQYYHTDRTYLSLGKDPPATRAMCAPTSPCARSPHFLASAAFSIDTSGERPPEGERWDFGEAQGLMHYQNGRAMRLDISFGRAV